MLAGKIVSNLAKDLKKTTPNPEKCLSNNIGITKL